MRQRTLVSVAVAPTMILRGGPNTGICAGGGTRTRTGVNPMVFETISAASFDTPARSDPTRGRHTRWRRSSPTDLVTRPPDQNDRMATPEKLFRLLEELRDLDEQVALVRAELEAHHHINDDALRDAAVSGHYIDREEAQLTSSDVVRFTTALERLGRRRAKLEEKRQRLLDRLD